MLLSNADVERLEAIGYEKAKFLRYDHQGFAKLQNHKGYCVFYDVIQCRCTVYQHRPQGCRIYPVVYSDDEGVTVDDLCPEKDTVTEAELQTKGREVVQLLKKIVREAASRSK
jgi:Fe-S-cluster containining protein